MNAHFKLTVSARGADANLPPVRVHAGETVLDAMRRADQSLYAPCAGRGVCGKCRIIAR
ncbi:MAG: 2Fe-2S iron-sulfur cluster-binding protein, partial [Bacillota bacterium]